MPANRRLGPAGIRRGIRGAPAGGGVNYIGPAYDSGDWTFTRASEASFYDPRTGEFADTGAAAWKGTNVARVFDDGAVLIEGARTNAFVRSKDLSLVTLLNSPTVTDDDGTAPDGGGASLIEFAAGGSLGQVRELCPDGLFTDGGTSVCSMFVEDPDGANVEILWRDKSLTTDFTGAQAMPTAWGRLTADVANGTGTSDPLMVIYENTDAADFHAWGVQVEPDAAFASSPIRTSGATATRAVDALSLADGTALDTGKWEFDFWPELSSADNALTLGVLARHNANDSIYINPSNLFRFNVGGASLVNTAVTWAAGAKLTVTVDWDAREVTLAGFLTGDNTYSLSGVATWATAGSSNLYVGALAAAGSSPFFGSISRIRSLR